MVNQYKDAHSIMITRWLDDLIHIQACVEAGGVDASLEIAAIEDLAERVQDYLNAYRSRCERQEEEHLGRQTG